MGVTWPGDNSGLKTSSVWLQRLCSFQDSTPWSQQPETPCCRPRVGEKMGRQPARGN